MREEYRFSIAASRIPRTFGSDRVAKAPTKLLILVKVHFVRNFRRHHTSTEYGASNFPADRHQVATENRSGFASSCVPPLFQLPRREREMAATPKDYAARYRLCPVYFEDGTKVNYVAGKYRIGMRDTTTKDSLWNAIRRHFRSESTLSVNVYVGGSSSITTYDFCSRDEIKFTALNAFWGKASPEEMQVTIELLDRFGVKARADLTQYCSSENIGVDCSGFVGNYIARILGTTAWHTQVATGAVGPKMKSNAIFNSYPIRVRDVTELSPTKRYVLGYCNSNGTPHGNSPTGHIVISDKPRQHQLTCIASDAGGQGSLGRLSVSESTGGIGAISSEYSIREVVHAGTSRAHFRVYRGSKASVLNFAIAAI